jgi:hypothetical protein
MVLNFFIRVRLGSRFALAWRHGVSEVKGWTTAESVCTFTARDCSKHAARTRTNNVQERITYKNE